MATKPVACEEHGPVNPPEDLVHESPTQSESDANRSHNLSLQDMEAPREEPQKDLDIVEPEALPLQESQTLSRPEIADDNKSENQESTGISVSITRDTQEEVEVEDSQPSAPVSSLSKEELTEKAGFSSPEGEEAKSITDSEIISHEKDLLSHDSHNSQKHPETCPLTEPLQEKESTSEETVDDTHPSSSQDASDNSKAENNTAQPEAAGINSTAHYSPTNRSDSNDVSATCSPPSADESEEEKDVSMKNTSCQQQLTKLAIKSKPLRPSHSISLSDITLDRLAVAQVKLREELLAQIRRELALRGANQETAQQVLSQALPPLSAVAMELSNKGGVASSQDSGRERQNRAGERAEGESTQTGGEEGQTEGGLDRNKAVGKQQSGGAHYSKAAQTRKPKPKRYRFVSSKHTRMESDSCDDSQSDSGVSADFSPCSTMESSNTVSPSTPVPAVKETPIEREIRRSIEREQSLRRSRGLPKQPTLPEYVEIPLKKTVLIQPQTMSPEKCQGKDRQFAGKKMRHEIHEEVQREEDLVKLGKVPGFYYKGTVRQLKERKKLFEAFQAPVVPTLPPPTRTRAKSWPFSTPSEILDLVNQDTATVRQTCLEKNPSSTKGGGSTSVAPRGPGFTEGTGCQVIIIENNLDVGTQNLYHTKPKTEATSTVDFARPSIPSHRTEGHGRIKVREQELKEEEEEELTPRENPFFKLRSSTNLVKVEQDIREAQERERELLKQRMCLYGCGGGGDGGGGGGRPANFEGRNTKLTRSSSLNRLPATDSPGSLPRPVTGPPAARQSVGKLGMWPPAQAGEEKTSRPDIFYSPRKKTPLVQRWEAGLINGHNQEDK
ncbi:uncharacterized protein misp3 [Cheilinus undulatus]|uniref:uncharacterized protein misp3 n=1 Tax=Cheilinus undulatus TaxID=241271 RepID=UPI001BD60C91|nr:uncharacterized protein misp3 [Cheilinus undulatus]